MEIAQHSKEYKCRTIQSVSRNHTAFLSPPSHQPAKRLVSTTMRLSSKRPLYITFIIPLLLAMFVSASAVHRTKRAELPTEEVTPKEELPPTTTLDNEPEPTPTTTEL